jgi:NitT/TauT family transport system permease protein
VKKYTISDRQGVILAIVFWVAAWNITAVVLDKPLYLPTLPATLKALGVLMTKADFWMSILFTFLRVISGLFISVVLGISFAYAASKCRIIFYIMSPFVSTMKSIPIISIIILALLWLGTGIVPIFICFLLCFPVVYTNVFEGISNVDYKLLEMAKVYDITRKSIFVDITLPSIKPYVYSAIMICVGLSWKSVVTAEVLSAHHYSLGYNVYKTKLYLETSELFALTLVVIAFSLTIEYFVRKGFEKKGKR